MNQYHKINNIFKRDTSTNKIIKGDFYMPEIEWLAGNQWMATEKIDGTNIRIMWDGENVTFGGKTDRAELHKDLVARLEKLFLPKKNLFAEKFGEKQVCFYGEGYGAGIQKGGKYKEQKDFIMFDVKIENVWLNRGDVVGIAHLFEVDFVPEVHTGTLAEMIAIVEEGLKSTFGDFIAEGIICKPVVEMQTRFGERIITKIKDRDFRNEANT